VRPALRCRLERFDDDRLHVLVKDLAGGSDPRLIVKAINSLSNETLPPLADRLVRRATAASDVGAAGAVGTRQNQLCSKGEMPV
jgi:hypothetical protein